MSNKVTGVEERTAIKTNTFTNNTTFSKRDYVVATRGVVDGGARGHVGRARGGREELQVVVARPLLVLDGATTQSMNENENDDKCCNIKTHLTRPYGKVEQTNLTSALHRKTVSNTEHNNQHKHEPAVQLQ